MWVHGQVFKLFFVMQRFILLLGVKPLLLLKGGFGPLIRNDTGWVLGTCKSMLSH
jgi:hypothetical protein